MGKHSRDLTSQVGPIRAVEAGSVRRARAPRTLPALAFLACTALILVPVVDPSAAFAMTSQAEIVEQVTLEGQSLTASRDYDATIERDNTFKVTVQQVEAAASTAPAVGKPDPGSAKAIAYEMLQDRGWGEKQYNCLVALWNRESHWNVYAHNKGSGAYGIPQALPGIKMASAGDDWASSAKTQIIWGLGYIKGRYGTPCGAWASSESRGWY